MRTREALTTEEIEERLHRLGKLVDRLKVMYEQYFMGIQKIAPAQLHRDTEREIRELTQANIRNTALRFRFANQKQKFGSYNTYWKRTLRQIEQGTYLKHIQRAARKAAHSGRELPDEILAAMPKRIREKIVRDRERLAKIEARKRGDEVTAKPPRPKNVISENDLSDLGGFDLLDGGDDFDLDSAFASITAEAQAAVDKHVAKPPPTPPPKPAPKPAARPATPARRPAPRPSAPRESDASPIPGMTLKQTRDLHRRYNQGQKLVTNGKAVTYDQLMKTLERQAPRIIKQTGAKGVLFKVAIKNDKVILKAKPKK